MMASVTTVAGGQLLSANSKNLPRAGVVLQVPAAYRSWYQARWPELGLTVSGSHRYREWAGDALTHIKGEL